MDWTRAQDVMPTFTAIETDRFLSLNSLDFNNYYSNGDPRRCPERSILFKKFAKKLATGTEHLLNTISFAVEPQRNFPITSLS
ncbi:hypothetical protein COOONC_20835 [Cooperia oncophora]